MMRWFRHPLRLGLCLGVVLLSGCLQYDLDVQFPHQTHGQVVQRIQWRTGDAIAQQTWADELAQLRDRTRQVGGKIRQPNDHSLEIVIPFNNGQDLAHKFNQFFGSESSLPPLTLPGGDAVSAQLAIQQGNWLVAIRNRLDIAIDLSTVPDLTEIDFPLLKNTQIFSGQIALSAPWVRLPSGVLADRKSWSLVPGQVNEIHIDFWVPSPIGIGALTIALAVVLGYTVKYGWRSRSSLP